MRIYNIRIWTRKLNNKLKANIILDIWIDAIILTRTIEYNQKIEVKAYNEMADYIYRKFNKNDMIIINGYINNVCEIIIKTVDIL